VRTQLPELAAKWRRILLIAGAAALAAGLCLLVFIAWWSRNPDYFK